MDSPSPSIDLIRVPALTSRAPYAYAAVVSDVRRLVFTAGACPLDEAGATVGVGDVTAQAEQVMANLRMALDAAGAGLSDVVKTTVYVASQRREDLVLAWNVVSEHFGDHDVPSTLLGVAVLGYRTNSSRSRQSPRCGRQSIGHVRRNRYANRVMSGYLILVYPHRAEVHPQP